MFVAANTRLMDAGIELSETSLKTGELAAAAVLVVGTRIALMVEAVQDPLNADHTEFGRMIPEKIEAFAEASAAHFKGWWSLQRDLVDHMLQIPLAVMQGDAAGLVERISTFGARLAAEAIGAAGVALVPLHKATTANARRLAERRS